MLPYRLDYFITLLYSLGVGRSCLYYILLMKFQELVVEPSNFVKGWLGCRFSLSSCNSPNFHSLCFHRVPQSFSIFLINKLLHLCIKMIKFFRFIFSIYSNFVSITISMLINNRVNTILSSIVFILSRNILLAQVILHSYLICFSELFLMLPSPSK